MGGHEALQCDAFINSLAELSGIVDTRHAQ
jgi:hypothetical protein